jgi:hypothetical protein
VGVDVTYAPDARWQLSGGWQFHTGWPYTEQTFAVDTASDGNPILVGTFGPLYAARLPPYHRVDARVTHRFALGRGELRVFLDVFNGYDRANLSGYDYDVRLMQGRAVVARSGRTLLPVLPTIGATWEF